jgi:hypothetical protein
MRRRPLRQARPKSQRHDAEARQPVGAVATSSPFDRLRVRTTVRFGSHKILILGLSKDEDFRPEQRLDPSLKPVR